MKFLIKTIPGMEEIEIEEIIELLKAKNFKKIIDGYVIFEAENYKNLRKALGIIKAMKLIDYFEFKNKDEIFERLSKIEFRIKEPFVVRCTRYGEHEFNSRDIESGIGEIIFNKGYSVNLTNPKTIISVEIVNDFFFIGILIADHLNKRKYRLRRNNKAIDSVLANLLVRYSRLKEKELIVDPFCKDGVIPIEAAIYAKKAKIWGLDDNINNVRNAKINAELAKVNIKILKYDVSWLGYLFKENSVDKIVTNPPIPTKKLKENKLQPIYEEFFFQAKNILKKEGILLIVTQKPEFVKRFSRNLFLLEEKKVFFKKMEYSILVFKKQKA